MSSVVFNLSLYLPSLEDQMIFYYDLIYKT